MTPRRFVTRDPLLNSYQRRIKIPELLGQGYFPADLMKAEAIEVRDLRDSSPVPRHPDQVATRQLFIPSIGVQKLLIPSYIQHMVSERKRPTEAVKSVKVYRVVHEIISQEQFVGAVFNDDGVKQRRITPNDPTTYLPYYLGSFDANGALLPQPDALRWWMVPILAKPGTTLSPVYLRHIKEADYDAHFDDYVKRQAGSDGYRKGP